MPVLIAEVGDSITGGDIYAVSIWGILLCLLGHAFSSHAIGHNQSGLQLESFNLVLSS